MSGLWRAMESIIEGRWCAIRVLLHVHGAPWRAPWCAMEGPRRVQGGSMDGVMAGSWRVNIGSMERHGGRRGRSMNTPRRALWRVHGRCTEGPWGVHGGSMQVHGGPMERNSPRDGVA